MVRAGCVSVAGIHPSRTWTSGSFESVRWNACVHRLDLGLYSHPKEFFLGMEFEPMLTPREKSPLRENVPRGGSNPWRCGQRVQTLPMSYSGPICDYIIQTRSTFACICDYIIQANVDLVFLCETWLRPEGWYGICFGFFLFFYLLSWHLLFWVSYMHVLYLHLFSATEHVSHGKVL